MNKPLFLRRRMEILAGLVALLVIGSVLWLALRPASGSRIAQIVQDGQILQEIDLTRVESPYDLRIESPDGGYNLVHVEKGSICVSEADCPDRLCVKMGTITTDRFPVTCLPHRLVLRILTEDLP